MIHELKTWPEYFQQVIEGNKKFEVRKSDRDFAVGDTLRLKEYDHEKEVYTGRLVHREITYILQGGSFGIDAGYCVMSLE